MALKLVWYDKNVDDYYIAGAIFDQFNEEEQKEKLLSLVHTDDPIFVYFSRIEDYLIVKEFSTQEPDDDDYCFELDDELIEFVIKNQNEDHIASYLAIMALQFYEFEVLRDILEITEEDLQDSSEEEKEEILGIQKEFQKMDPEVLNMFLEKEIYFYSKEDLEEFLLTHS